MSSIAPWMVETGAEEISTYLHEHYTGAERLTVIPRSVALVLAGKVLSATIGQWDLNEKALAFAVQSSGDKLSDDALLFRAEQMLRFLRDGK